MRPILTRDSDHRYWLGGKELAPVSRILNVIAPYQYSDPVAMLRGTAVHLATEYWDRQTLDPASVDPAIAGYLEAWKNFRSVTGFVPTLDSIETYVADSDLGVAGTYDRLGTMPSNGAAVLLDIKTGAHHWRYDVQVTAYDYLQQKWLGVPPTPTLLTVCLNETGGWRMHAVEARSAMMNIFLCGVTIYHARKNYGD